MSEKKWERIPEDTDRKCRKMPTGWATKDFPNCCGKQAVWYRASTCGCGECDMSMQFCEDHYQEQVAGEEKSRARRKIISGHLECLKCGYKRKFDDASVLDDEDWQVCNICGSHAMVIAMKRPKISKGV